MAHAAIKRLGTVEALMTGKVRALANRPERKSGIRKTPADGPVRLTATGLAGDEQGEKKHHGGLGKALHHYPYDHYPALRARLADTPAIRILENPGAFGENISTTGITERDVCIGDKIRIGGALVQISQGRQPCYTLNFYFGVPEMSRIVQSLRATGWYYRVLEEGEIRQGDPIDLLERPNPDWPVDAVQLVLYEDTLNGEALKILSELPELDEGWRGIFAERLRTGVVEDWGRRLG